MKTRKKTYAILLIFFFSFLFFLRLIHLGANPPRDLSYSMGYMGDPGGYVLNARNKILFGQWEMDKWNNMHISPLLHYLTYASFVIFGTGIVQMNLLPALFSCLILILSYLVLRRTYPKVFALLGTFLLGITFQFVMFSRIAVRVMPLLFFVILILFFLEERHKIKSWIFFAGIFSFIAFTVKGTYLQILPSIGLGLALYLYFRNQKDLKKTITPLILFVSGMALVFVFWLFIFYIPHKDMFLSFGGKNYSWLTPKNFLDAFRNFWRSPLFYFIEMPILTPLAGLSLLVICYKAFTSPKKISLVNWVCSFWYISNIIYFSVISYHASRHFILVVIPIVFLGMSFLHDLYKTQTIQKAQKSTKLFFVFLFFWLFFPIAAFFIKIKPPFLFPEMYQEMKTTSLITLGIAFFITALTYFLFRAWPKNFRIKLSPALKICVISLLILFSVYNNAKKYSVWALSPCYDFQTISRDFGKMFDHMVVAGRLATVISLENKHETHSYSSGYINKGLDFIKKYKITHAFLSTHAAEIEKSDYQNDFPDEMRNARLLARYSLYKTYYVELYDLYPPPLPPEDIQHIYEGELFYVEKGIPRFDPQASRTLALKMEKNKKGSMSKYPEVEFPPGEYSAVFFLKGDNNLSEKNRIGRIDIVNAAQKKVYAYKNIYPQDMESMENYQEISIPFHVKRDSKIDIRVYSTGIGDLWLDKVKIIQKD